MAQCFRHLMIPNYIYKLPCQRINVTILPSVKPTTLSTYNQYDIKSKECNCCKECCCFPYCKYNMPIFIDEEILQKYYKEDNI